MLINELLLIDFVENVTIKQSCSRVCNVESLKSKLKKESIHSRSIMCNCNIVKKTTFKPLDQSFNI